MGITDGDKDYESTEDYKNEKPLPNPQPCHFCGTKVELERCTGETMDWISCQSCGATGPIMRNQRSAILAWNSRA